MRHRLFVSNITEKRFHHDGTCATLDLKCKTLSFKSIRVTPIMITSSNGNIFRVTGPLWEEFTGHRWIPLIKASDAELWCFLWSPHEQTIEQTIKMPMILNRHHAHYDVTVMWVQMCLVSRITTLRLLSPRTRNVESVTMSCDHMQRLDIFC